jgi:hypothetical protein
VHLGTILLGLPLLRSFPSARLLFISFAFWVLVPWSAFRVCILAFWVCCAAFRNSVFCLLACGVLCLSLCCHLLKPEGVFVVVF